MKTATPAIDNEFDAQLTHWRAKLDELDKRSTLVHGQIRAEHALVVALLQSRYNTIQRKLSALIRCSESPSAQARASLQTEWSILGQAIDTSLYQFDRYTHVPSRAGGEEA
jgi:hypothetical protein